MTAAVLMAWIVWVSDTLAAAAWLILPVLALGAFLAGGAAIEARAAARASEPVWRDVWMLPIAAGWLSALWVVGTIGFYVVGMLIAHS
ncbi:MAG: hypothetical protein U1E26_04055 [Coriobacteriia bacterium]|nr:hypothetical protein [Coriobacteriia bacterium]